MISTCHLAAGRLPVNTLLLRGRLLLRRGLPGVVLPHLRCRDVHGHVSRVTSVRARGQVTTELLLPGQRRDDDTHAPSTAARPGTLTPRCRYCVDIVDIA